MKMLHRALLIGAVLIIAGALAPIVQAGEGELRVGTYVVTGGLQIHGVNALNGYAAIEIRSPLEMANGDED